MLKAGPISNGMLAVVFSMPKRRTFLLQLDGLPIA